MELVTVFLSKALICFSATCHPVLLGPQTQPGNYVLKVLHTQQPGYGGDVLMYDANDREWFAIHRTYNLGNVRRAHLYANTTPRQRRVTAGCVNVQPAVYTQLRACCSNARLEIIE